MANKGKGVLSYLLGWIGALIVLCGMKDNTKKDVMHAGQAIIINFSWIVINIAGFAFILTDGSLSYLSRVFSILYVILIIMGIVKVLNDSDPKLPIIGDLAESLFSKQLSEAPDNVFKSQRREPKYDPKTGELLYKANNMEPKYDPNTGELLNKDNKVD